MSLILNIDTATELASICLSKDGEVISTVTNTNQKDHAAWIQQAISGLMKESGFAMHDLAAVAVTQGPGSYTGLRVGLATAKGLCYALNIPLIAENTLLVMAYAAREKWLSDGVNASQQQPLFCPMIDARRMEVFTALYNFDLNIVMTPNVLILDEFSFKEELNNFVILFSGNGYDKWKHVATHVNARFDSEMYFLAPFLCKLAAVRFSKQQFTDLVYSEPVYLKEFYTYTKN